MITVEALPAFSDNYLWLIHDGRSAAVVDPGDAAVVERALAERGLELTAILVTHHHPDHIGGLPALTRTRTIPVYGPRAEATLIPGLTQLLDDGDQVSLADPACVFKVLAVPGHTLGHIAFHCAGHALLFCGDTLFSAGCGRLFEGTPAQMHASLSRLAQLPAATTVYCAHEYTVANLDFAAAVEPGNPAIATATARALQTRARNQPTLPSSIAHERAVNPFLRTRVAAIAAAARQHADRELPDEVAVFTELRRWKDDFVTNIR